MMMRLILAGAAAALVLAPGQAGAGEPGPRAGVSEVGLAQLDRHFESRLAQGDRAGYAILIARDGEIVYERYLGYADLEARRPLDAQTPFRLASMTKPMTQAAAMQLFEQGRIQLTDPVSRYIPEFAEVRVAVGRDGEGRPATAPVSRPITILDLMTHTSGLGARTPQLNPVAAELYSASLEAYYFRGDSASKARLLAGLPLWHQPGEHWGYGIYATDVLGRLVEVVAGEPLDQVLRRTLIDPLQMRHTGFLLSGRTPPNLSAIYTHGASGELERVEHPPLDRLTAPHGGGGLYSTARDYLRFAEMLRHDGRHAGEQLLAPSSIRMMTRNALPPALLPIDLGIPLPAGGFGLGLGVATADAPAPASPFAEGDFWWAGSTDTFFFVSPSRGITAIILAQAQPSPTTPWRTWGDFAALVNAAVTAR